MAPDKVNQQAAYEAEAKASAGIAEPTTKPAKRTAKADKPKVDVDKALAETQAPQHDEVTVSDPASPATSTPHTIAQDAAAPAADADLPKVDAANTREEAAAKAEDPAGAGAGDAV